MKLTNPSDDELNAAFAENVAGWVNQGKAKGVPALNNRWVLPDRSLVEGPLQFVRSADAVLPWLEKTFCVFSYHTDRPDGRLQFCADKRREGQLIASSGTFPRAAVIALLIAHGVEVEFTQ